MNGYKKSYLCYIIYQHQQHIKQKTSKQQQQQKKLKTDDAISDVIYNLLNIKKLYREKNLLLIIHFTS